MNAKDIVDALKTRGWTLGSIESFTGGLFASEVTSVPGASSVFKGSVVTYATEEKINILKIPEATVKQFGVVSKEVACAMANNGRQLLNVDFCISFTGNAGPSAMENKPVGEIYIGLSVGSLARVYAYNLKGSRDEIRNEAIKQAYLILENILKESK